MSMTWSMSNVRERAVAQPPSIWVYGLLYVVVELIAVVATIWVWPRGQPTASAEFLLEIVVAPVLIWLALCCIYYSRAFEDSRSKAQWWNLLCGTRFCDWQRWARAHLVLLDSAVLTPEKELAQRMLGLAPSVPINPEKALQLAGIDASMSQTRQEQLIERLMASLVDSIKFAAQAGKIDVMLHASDEAHKLSIERAWRKLGLPGLPDVTWLSFDDESPLLGKWFAGQSVPDYRLLIALQLHQGEDVPAFSEAAVAILFTRPSVLAHSKNHKARACILRPIFAEPDTVGAAVATLLRAEQVPQKKIRNLWFSRLNSLEKNSTAAAARDAELEVREQDLDRAIGKPGPITGWLIQALAAEMVQHGQGAQLVATPQRGGVALNLVSVAPPPVPYPQDRDVPLLSVVWALGMMFLSGFVLCLHKIAPSVMSVDFTIWLCIGVMVLILFQAGLAFFDREHDTRTFRETFY
ncbi:hypothetical protein QCE49_05870 [Caballeronia sp. LZ008]|uniref:hypothetical protein n=1 Tax=unclassified Caballeronia TaxID=2646786 RepID=UPI0020279485|nr:MULTISPECIES: hypothetical protein [unclassified Caballeronia]MDR5792903.1 hypothetical protein [Caballeronia sp. LZ008]